MNQELTKEEALEQLKEAGIIDSFQAMPPRALRRSLKKLGNRFAPKKKVTHNGRVTTRV